MNDLKNRIRKLIDTITGADALAPLNARVRELEALVNEQAELMAMTVDVHKFRARVKALETEVAAWRGAK